MNRLIPRKRWHFVLVAAVVAALGGTLFARLAVDAPPTLHATLQQMRDQPARWTRTEGDASVLIMDMQKNVVAGAAIAPTGIFISTKDGRDYFVADHSGRFSGLVVGAYQRAGTDAFPFAVLDKDAGSHDWRADLSLLLDHVEDREGQPVADPYFGNDDGFDVTWADVTAGARG